MEAGCTQGRAAGVARGIKGGQAIHQRQPTFITFCSISLRLSVEHTHRCRHARTSPCAARIYVADVLCIVPIR